MKKMNINNLSGRALDFAVAVVLKLQVPEKIECHGDALKQARIDGAAQGGDKQ